MCLSLLFGLRGAVAVEMWGSHGCLKLTNATRHAHDFDFEVLWGWLVRAALSPFRAFHLAEKK